MIENKILPFAVNDIGTNLLTDIEYFDDSQRLIGNQPGIARSKLVNKALKQSSLMAAALAEFGINNTDLDIQDSYSEKAIADILQKAIENIFSNILIGSVSYFANLQPPKGWLPADGSAVSRTMYKKLFHAINTTYGTGDGLTTFGLPDLRGEYIRGFDAGRGVDPGRSLGSFQDWALADHAHLMQIWTGTVGTSKGETQTKVYAPLATSGDGGVINSETVGIGVHSAARASHTGSVQSITKKAGSVIVRNIALAAYIYAGI